MFQRGLEQLVPGDIVGHDVAQTQALGRRVLDVAHVEIKPAAVEEKSAVTRRLFVIAIVQVDRAGLRFAKQIILYPDRPGVGMGAAFVVADEAAVLRLNAGDAVHVVQRWSRA